MTDDVVAAAYSERAREYAELFGSIDAADELDRRTVSAWASTLRGPILDAGCGPGQWTDFLVGLGHEVEGVDLVPAFVELASARYPRASFRVASFEDLDRPDASLAGVLAWYSLIHASPDALPAVLGELARCVEPGGGMLVGFFASERQERFAHAVTPAYSWPVDELAEHLESAGFVVEDARTRSNPDRPDRTHGAIRARRQSRVPSGRAES